MKKGTLNILGFDGEGYKPIVDFGNWRVAFLRFLDELVPENIYRLERHVIPPGFPRNPKKKWRARLAAHPTNKKNLQKTHNYLRFVS